MRSLLFGLVALACFGCSDGTPPSAYQYLQDRFWAATGLHGPCFRTIDGAPGRLRDAACFRFGKPQRLRGVAVFHPLRTFAITPRVPAMIRFLVPALAAATAPQADQQPLAEKEQLRVVFTVSARPDRCNLTVATKVDLRALATEPGIWAGKCVAVDGYWKYNALFASSRDARGRDSRSDGALSARRVGIYGTDELMSSMPGRPLAYTAIGIAGECATLAEGTMMVMGYCHYTGGPYIAVAEMRSR